MAKGTLSADGSTDWLTVWDSHGVHIAGKGTFGGGTLTVEQRIQGSTYNSQSPDGSTIAHTSNFDRLVEFKLHDEIRLTLVGATTPDLDWSISGYVN